MAAARTSKSSGKQLRQRVPKKQIRSRIVIPLSSHPADYVPGSGPPLQRVSLVPHDDSTGYIVERIFLPSPGMASNGRPLPRRMTYIVGWRDLPAARVLVPAMEILDYVSPRALEEWEWEMELEVEQDRLCRAEEKKMEEKAADAGVSGAKKKKKARPPAHTAIESAAVVEAEGEVQMRPKKGAMSLMTPQKPRVEETEDEYPDEDDNSPSRQLAQESAWPWGGMDPSMQGMVMDETAQFESDSERGISPETVERLKNSWTLPPDLFDEEMGTAESSQGVGQNYAAEEDPPSVTPVPVPILKQTPGTGGSSGLINGGFTSFNQGHVRSDNWNRSGADTTPQTHAESKASSSAKAGRKKPTSSRKSASKKRPSATQEAATQPVVDEEGQAAWVVKRLLDMDAYETEDRRLVRYFQVLWEGNWPEDQNPTWEPEENLPAKLVRNFIKSGTLRRKERLAARRRVASRARRPVKLGRQFGSVGEAFADGAEMEAGGGGGLEAGGDGGSRVHEKEAEEGGMDEEVFVVDKDASPGLLEGRRMSGGYVLQGGA